MSAFLMEVDTRVSAGHCQPSPNILMSEYMVRLLEPRRKAELLRLLAHPTRLAILETLLPGAKCVTDIQDLLDVPQANVSQHLHALRREHIVDYHEDGTLRCYYLTRPKLARALLRFLSDDYPVVTRSAESVRREGRRRERGTPRRAAM